MESMCEALKNAGLLSPKQQSDLEELEKSKRRIEKFKQELMVLKEKPKQEKELTANQETIVGELVLNYIAPIKTDPCFEKVQTIIAELRNFRAKHSGDREWIKAIDALISNIYILKTFLYSSDGDLQERKKVLDDHKFPNFLYVF